MKTMAVLLLLAAALLFAGCADDDDDNADDATPDDDNDGTPPDDDDNDDDDAVDDDENPDFGGPASLESSELWLTGITRQDDAWRGFFVHFQHGRWTFVEPPVPMDYLDALSVRDANHALAADYETVVRYDGAEWSVDNTLPTTWGKLWIYDVLSTAEEDWVFAGCDNDLLVWLRWCDGEWAGGLFPGEGHARVFDVVNEVDGDTRVAVWDSGDLADTIWRFDRTEETWVVEYPGWLIIKDMAFGDGNTGVALGAWLDPPLSYDVPLRYNETGWHLADDFPDMADSASAAYRDAEHLAVVASSWDEIFFLGTEFWEQAGSAWSLVDYLENQHIGLIRAQDERTIWAIGHEVIDGYSTGAGIVYRWDDVGLYRHIIPGIPYDSYTFSNIGLVRAD
jgi:hypothetical protein